MTVPELFKESKGKMITQHYIGSQYPAEKFSSWRSYSKYITKHYGDLVVQGILNQELCQMESCPNYYNLEFITADYSHHLILNHWFTYRVEDLN